MTIKEMELRCGVDRANIRYYEREGLLAPTRLQNGYRDYSEEDLELLLRIRLLRSLQLSLDDIRALKEGKSELGDTLFEQMARLERQRLDVACAQSVCRAIREERVGFSQLRAEKYLERIKREQKGQGEGFFSVQGDVLPQVFSPWRRFFARMLDLWLYETVWLCFLGLAFHSNLAARSGVKSLLDTLVATAAMLFLEPLLLSLRGTTFGKAILGLRVEDSDGALLSYSEALERTWGVLRRGLGYRIPIYNLACLYQSYRRCKEGEAQPWDDDIAYICTGKQGPTLLAARGGLAFATLCAVLVTTSSLAQLPPNRGELTQSGFVQNYNYYANFLDLDLGGHLDEDGRWVEEEQGVYVVDIAPSEQPDIRFLWEGEELLGVAWSVELEDESGLVGAYQTPICLTALALAGAQPEVRLWSAELRRITRALMGEAFSSFSFEEAGLVFTCRVEYEGYTLIGGLLIPQEEVQSRRFAMSFSAVQKRE